MWVANADLPRTAGHPFYERLNRVLEAGFDAFVEEQCAKFYADGVGVVAGPVHLVRAHAVGRLVAPQRLGSALRLPAPRRGHPCGQTQWVRRRRVPPDTSPEFEGRHNRRPG